jgi:phenylalanyl-tRNA synthetase alpha chain
MLADGSWKGKTFRSYNVKVPPTRLSPGRTNPYAKFLEEVKDKLASLGFEEFDGPLVETEFWNSDALFMPQFHSARDIHDVYRIDKPSHAKAIEEPWLSNVAAAHENGGKTGSRGWSYAFDRDFTRRLILRSQGTVLSAKTLPKAKIPGKYFGIVRCFRYDRVDATHLPDFYQTEGIVLGEEVNLKTLLGMLEMFALEVAGAKEVKYVPGYFPFTEPSVEVHIKHPVLGWFELGGSGIFRPEVTESLGVNVPVAAWGIGIDRMALMALGLNDLRELFSYDIEHVRLRRTNA